MVQKTLKGLRVAILATNGFEQSELLEPRRALHEAGADAQVISLQAGKIRGWNHKDWGQEVDVDATLEAVEVKDFDGLLLPGGVMNPDTLRTQPAAVAFVKGFFEVGKPVAAICHGPWTLIEAGVVKGRKMTSWPSLRTDIINGGGQWTDDEVVVDGNLVTSRKPDDLPAFNREIVALFGKVHSRQAA